MAKPELGTKRVDPETGRKFYDLGKDPIVSPFTGKEYPLSYFETVKATASRVSRAAEREEEETEEEVVETADGDEETVSLAEVEEDEDAGSKGTDLPNVDGDEDDDVADDDSDDDDTFLEADEDEDGDMTDIIGGGREDDDA